MSFLISTPRLLLRQVRDGDLDIIYSIINQESVSKWVPQIKLTYEQTQEMLSEAQKQYVIATKEDCKILHACIEKGTNQFVGIVAMTSMGPIKGDVVMLACILEEKRNKGFATEAIQSLAHCGLKRLQFDYLSAIVDVNNIVAKRVAEKCGFEQISAISGHELGFDDDNLYHYYRLYNHNIN